MFGRGKAQKKKEIPEYSENPMTCYVYRLEPKKFGGKRLEGAIQGSGFTGIHCVEELERQIAEVAGGGDYKCTFYDYSGPSRTYVGEKRLSISGDPKIDGKPISAEEGEKKKDPRKKYESELAEKEAEIEAAEKDRKLEERRKKMERDRADHEDEKTGQIESLVAQVQELQATLQMKDEEARETRRENEFRELIKSQGEQMREIIKGLAPPSGGEDKTLEAMRMILESMDKNRLEASGRTDKMYEMFSAQAREQANALVTTMGDQAGRLMESTQAGWELGARMSSGNIPAEPVTVADVINNGIGSLSELVGKFIDTRGAGGLTKKKVEEMAASVAREATEKAAAARSRRRLNPPDENPRAAMNDVLRLFIEETRSGKPNPTWMGEAIRRLPRDVTSEFREIQQTGNDEEFEVFLHKYADDDVAEKVLKLVGELGAESAESEPSGPDTPAPDTSVVPAEKSTSAKKPARKRQ